MKLSLRSKKPVIEKAIKKFGKTLSITRDGVNEFKEPNKSIEVCRPLGFYYRGRSMLKTFTNVAGTNSIAQEEKLMIVIDDESKKIKKGDKVKINDTSYKLADLGNSFDLYFDITLERVD